MTPRTRLPLRLLGALAVFSMSSANAFIFDDELRPDGPEQLPSDAAFQEDKQKPHKPTIKTVSQDIGEIEAELNQAKLALEERKTSFFASMEQIDRTINTINTRLDSLEKLAHKANKSSKPAPIVVKAEVKVDPMPSAKMQKYPGRTGPAPKIGEMVELFGTDFPVTKIDTSKNPVFAELDDFVVTMPYRPEGKDDNTARIRIGFSSYPRSFAPFANYYGPPTDRVTMEAIKIDGHDADYGIGLMSDYGQNYASAVINIELKAGLFMSVRIGMLTTDVGITSAAEVTSEIHSMLSAISISPKPAPKPPKPPKPARTPSVPMGVSTPPPAPPSASY
jgi:hypothetical protein